MTAVDVKALGLVVSPAMYTPLPSTAIAAPNERPGARIELCGKFQARSARVQLHQQMRSVCRQARLGSRPPGVVGNDVIAAVPPVM